MVVTAAEKQKTYESVAQSAKAILADTPHIIARMATLNCLLSEAFPYYYWTGFYLLDEYNPQNLIVGPYQGTMGCLHIPFGKGVCGTAAQTGKSQVVEDVHALENHIACDSRSRSEIVVPVWDKDKNLIAVFDVDSTEKNSFDGVDQQYLEKLMHMFFAN